MKYPKSLSDCDEGDLLETPCHIDIIFLSFQLPLLASTSGDILEVFLVKHSLVCNQLGRFSFSSKTFRPEEKNRRTLSPTSGQGPGFGQAINEVVSFNIFCIYHPFDLFSFKLYKSKSHRTSSKSGGWIWIRRSYSISDSAHRVPREPAASSRI